MALIAVAVILFLSFIRTFQLQRYESFWNYRAIALTFLYILKREGRNILMLVSLQTTFVLSQIWVFGKNYVPLQSNCVSINDNDISSFNVA